MSTMSRRKGRGEKTSEQPKGRVVSEKEGEAPIWGEKIRRRIKKKHEEKRENQEKKKIGARGKNNERKEE